MKFSSTVMKIKYVRYCQSDQRVVNRLKAPFTVIMEVSIFNTPLLLNSTRTVYGQTTAALG